MCRITDSAGSSHPGTPSSLSVSFLFVARSTPVSPYLAELLAAPPDTSPKALGRRLDVASYNVHRWAGVRGGRTYDPTRAFAVIDELNADVLALQEVLRPTDHSDPLREIAARLGYHLAFVVTRIHKRGELGNAVLSRWPLAGALAIDLTFGRLERRAALAVTVRGGKRTVQIAATHLALVDRTRARQVDALLCHPQMTDGPVVLLGDMNAWRPTKASRALDDHFQARHHNANWPASYPSVRPVLALDRMYARGAEIQTIAAHTSDAARRGSDHLPIVARLRLGA